MPRNDSILLTGMTSHSVNKLELTKRKEEERKNTKIEKKNRIAPSIEPVIEELMKERDRTILQQVDLVDSATDEDFKAQALALKLYKESMNNLKSRLSNIMRVEAE